MALPTLMRNYLTHWGHEDMPYEIPTSLNSPILARQVRDMDDDDGGNAPKMLPARVLPCPSILLGWRRGQAMISTIMSFLTPFKAVLVLTAAAWLLASPGHKYYGRADYDEWRGISLISLISRGVVDQSIGRFRVSQAKDVFLHGPAKNDKGCFINPGPSSLRRQ